MTVQEALTYWRMLTGKAPAPASFMATHHATVDALDALGQEVERLAAWAVPLPTFGTWRGVCGHVWDRPRGDATDADCPLCTLQARVRELQGGRDARE